MFVIVFVCVVLFLPKILALMGDKLDNDYWKSHATEIEEIANEYRKIITNLKEEYQPNFEYLVRSGQYYFQRIVGIKDDRLVELNIINLERKENITSDKEYQEFKELLSSGKLFEDAIILDLNTQDILFYYKEEKTEKTGDAGQAALGGALIGGVTGAVVGGMSAKNEKTVTCCYIRTISGEMRKPVEYFEFLLKVLPYKEYSVVKIENK